MENVGEVLGGEVTAMKKWEVLRDGMIQAAEKSLGQERHR